MKKFPCKECLVKPACSHYCNQLEQDPKVITMYIDYNDQCPDCGLRSQFCRTQDSIIAICNSCIKVFEKLAIVKATSVLPNILRISPIIKEGSIIKDPYKPFPAVSDDITMEESHDMLYKRMPISMAKYSIGMYNKEILKMLKSPKEKPSHPLGWPSWYHKYPTLFEYNEEKQASIPIII